MIQIGNLQALANAFKTVMKSINNVRTAKLTGDTSKLNKFDNALAKLSFLYKTTVVTVENIATPDLSDTDISYMVHEALMEIVPVEFEGTMIGLRVVNTLDAQLYGLANALGDYIDVDPTEVIEPGITASVEEIEQNVRDAVAEQIDDISDKEGVCKNFWNGYDLEEYL